MNKNNLHLICSILAATDNQLQVRFAVTYLFSNLI